MFPMSPEDKFREVMDYQEGQRRQMARERMARAASGTRNARSVGVGGATRAYWRDLLLSVGHALRSLTRARGEVRSRAR